MSTTDQEKAKQAQAWRTAGNVLELLQVRRQLRHDRDTIARVREAIAYGRVELDPNLRVHAEQLTDHPEHLTDLERGLALGVLGLLDLVDDVTRALDRTAPGHAELEDNRGEPDQSADQSGIGHRAHARGDELPVPYSLLECRCGHTVHPLEPCDVSGCGCKRSRPAPL